MLLILLPTPDRGHLADATVTAARIDLVTVG